MTARRGPRVRRGSAPGLLRAAARDLFAERGYAATTRDIAERAGVSHDLIFRYFESKEKLLLDAVLTPLLDAVDALHRDWLEDERLHALGGEEVARRFTAAFYRFMEDNQPIARAMVHLFTEASPDGELGRLRQRIAETLVPITETMASFLPDHAMRHTDPGLHLRMVFLIVGAVALFLPNTYADDPDAPPREVVIEELSRFLYSGLTSRAAPA